MDFYHPEWPEKFGAAVLTASQNVPENSVVGISIASTVSVVDAVAMVRTAQSFGCNLANIRHDQLANPLLSPLILCEILRGETGVFVLSSGVLETRDSANTAIAAGRVDLVPLIL